MLNEQNLRYLEIERLPLSLQESSRVVSAVNSISSSDKLAEGLVESDRGSFENSLSVPIEDSAILPTPRLDTPKYRQ